MKICKSTKPQTKVYFSKKVYGSTSDIVMTKLIDSLKEDN